MLHVAAAEIGLDDACIARHLARRAAGDLAALYKMGVHPLLLAPYSRFMAIPRPKYQSALDPLRGLRTLRS